MVTSTKKAALEVIQALPEDTTFDDIFYHLYVREKVERGIQAIDDGRVITQEEAERTVQEWFE